MGSEEKLPEVSIFAHQWHTHISHLSCLNPKENLAVAYLTNSSARGDCPAGFLSPAVLWKVAGSVKTAASMAENLPAQLCWRSEKYRVNVKWKIPGEIGSSHALVPWSCSWVFSPVFDRTCRYLLSDFPSVLGHPEPLVAWVKIFQFCKMNTLINTRVGNWNMAILIS